MLDKLRYSLYRFKYTHADKLNLSKPVDISLELSSFCTNACGYCYHADPKNLPFTRGKMSFELAYKILTEAAELGVHSIKYNYRGEATMNPRFKDIAEATYFFSISNGSTFIDRILNSNFNFDINRGDIFQGLNYMTKVKISFDSFRKDIFEKQRKGSNFEKTLANMEKFYNWPGRKNEMVVQAVRTSMNADEDLESEIKKRFPSATPSIRDVVSGRVNKDISNLVTKERDINNRKSCLQAHARLIVNHDGRVTVCCPDIGSKIVVGDANTDHIKDIWKSQRALEIRRSLKDKSAFEKDPCKTCSSFESYAGFKARWDS